MDKQKIVRRKRIRKSWNPVRSGTPAKEAKRRTGREENMHQALEQQGRGTPPPRQREEGLMCALPRRIYHYNSFGDPAATMHASIHASMHASIHIHTQSSAGR
eukprot:GHVU01154027.1.p3 GENE.GHVU01154027.1~~GHVU01154027.1.p3  ORF type:complete len:103 (+),score=11.35 GHVU01154027.1:44-352(+)